MFEEDLVNGFIPYINGYKGKSWKYFAENSGFIFFV